MGLRLCGTQVVVAGARAVMRLCGVLALLASLTAALPAAAASASPWRVQQTPNQSVPNGALLSASCTSVTACTAVGYHTNDAGAMVGLAEAWNGKNWRTQVTPTPAGATHSQFFGVSCTSASACTAVGFSAISAGREVTLAERWNGIRWHVQATPNPAGATGARLFGVSCTSASACTAVGSYLLNSPVEIPFAEAWNGTRWKLQATPRPVGDTGAQLSGVSCTSASACTAAGAYTSGSSALLTLAERWNGTSWRIQATPNAAGGTGSGLSGVSCTSASACTASGDSLTGSGDRSLAEAWNGTTWRIRATPNPVGTTSTDLFAVSCRSASACTAVGTSFISSSHQDLPVAERWNGTSWTLQSTPNPGEAVLTGVSCPSHRGCTAVGYNNTATGVLTVAEAWNGTDWRTQATANPVGIFGGILNDVSCTSASDCTAVGHYSTGISNGPPTAFAEMWNGTRWHIQQVPSPAGAAASDLSAVSCTSASACTAVGSYANSTGTRSALAERWNGTSWSIQATPSPSTTFTQLSGVSCPAADACTAVGDYTDGTGTQLTLAEAWNGTTWSIQATPNPAGAPDSSLRSVSCTSAQACTAVGDHGASTSPNLTLAERWNGTAWTIQDTPNPSAQAASQLFGVSCSSADACTAIGYNRDLNGSALALAEAWNGTVWSIQPTPNPVGALGGFLDDVSCTSASTCTAVGDYTNSTSQLTLAEVWNGTAWTIQATPNPVGATASELRGISCISASACTAAGDYFGSRGTPLTLAESTF